MTRNKPETAAVVEGREGKKRGEEGLSQKIYNTLVNRLEEGRNDGRADQCKRRDTSKFVRKEGGSE